MLFRDFFMTSWPISTAELQIVCIVTIDFYLQKIFLRKTTVLNNIML